MKLEYLQKREYERTINYRKKANYWNDKQDQYKPIIYNKMDASSFNVTVLLYKLHFTGTYEMKHFWPLFIEKKKYYGNTIMKNSGLLCRILNDDQEIVLVCKENRIKKITLLMYDHIHQSMSDKYQTHIWL